jgi:hypothetical protein
MDIQDVRLELKNKEKEYNTIKELCESKIVNWQWATFDIFSLQPYFFERNNFKKGRLLKREPNILINKVKIGFDINSSIVVSQDYTKFKMQFYENFYIYHNDEVFGYRFSYHPEKDLISTEYAKYNNNKIIEFSRLGIYGYCHEKYIYEGNMTTEIHEKLKGRYSKNEENRRLVLKYNDDTLEEIYSVTGDWVLYKR